MIKVQNLNNVIYEKDIKKYYFYSSKFVKKQYFISLH